MLATLCWKSGTCRTNKGKWKDDYQLIKKHKEEEAKIEHEKKEKEQKENDK